MLISSSISLFSNWLEVNTNQNTKIIWLVSDLRPTKTKTSENEEPLRKRRPPTKTKTLLFFAGNETILLETIEVILI